MHQKQWSYQCWEFESLIFQLWCHWISVDDDDYFFDKWVNEDELQFSYFNQNLTFSALTASVWLTKELTWVNDELSWSLCMKTSQVSIDDSF